MRDEERREQGQTRRHVLEVRRRPGMVRRFFHIGAMKRRMMHVLPKRRAMTPLLVRILLLNILPLALLAVTLLFLDQFQNSLLETDVNALREQAHIYAGAVGQFAAKPAPRGVRSLPGEDYVLDAALARSFLTRLTEPSPNATARLFDPDGKLVADSREDRRVRSVARPERGAASSLAVKHEEHVDGAIPSLEGDSGGYAPASTGRSVEAFYDWLVSLLPLTSSEGIVTLNTPDPIPDTPVSGRANEAVQASPRQVELPPFIRRLPDHQLAITVVEPVIHDGLTVGIIQLTRQAPEVDRSLFEVRSSILSLFLGALMVTVLLSWYLSRTIARPLLSLARASREMRESDGRRDVVPDQLLIRRDEIGVLARSLRGSALALWARMDDIERFAADVSHEIKNPLSSIRSAIETLPRIALADRRERLLSIMTSDVKRLDRLITDISDASRIDAELSRARPEPVSVVALLSILVEMHQTTRKDDAPILRLDVPDNGPALRALAVEDRLVQVLRNLIGNAISFSPPRGVIALHASCRDVAGTGPGTGSVIEIAVSDQGPGIPAGKLENIFDRFYSERPQSEHFGQHSGLGLAISRQIINALRGRLFAENVVGPAGEVRGACFVVRLPSAG
ncbi:stimulus-sensing domain-containing protein [Neokomagataea sp. TBRC 2177]|uniref:histidine kinase n=2 Tax=Neokomagataea anthophila TaxID=2826925 RepID=A0ABS5E3W8_9PROT|nr:stimulus-sensing domain-containing protein [Neokomagataea anthophila]